MLINFVTPILLNLITGNYWLTAPLNLTQELSSSFTELNMHANPINVWSTDV